MVPAQVFHIMIPVHFSNFWKLYPGKFFETMCWESQMDGGGFWHKATASYYGFKAMAPGEQVEHPGSADLSRMMRSEASEVIGRPSRGMEMLNQCWLQK